MTFDAMPMHTFSQLEQMVFTSAAAGRLLAATLLGGIIGIEREYNHKSAGVRTNLLICLGCAFFTVLSTVLAGDANPDKGRVASNIVQGIGFLGGGLILHNRSRVSGLTSAAGVFVVAAIGMACGAGMYSAAVLATLLVLFAMTMVGVIERRFNLKIYPLVYEVRGGNRSQMVSSVLDAMDSARQRLASYECDTIGAMERVSFVVVGTLNLHKKLEQRLLQEPAIDTIHSFRDPEED
jgi:putative Mg2+ transporter-C (MgtC) family protein